MNAIKRISPRSMVFGIALGLASLTTAAQPTTDFEVVASGLNAPRGLKFGPDGELYIALAGTGGSMPSAGLKCQQVPIVGPYFGGSSGAIVKLGHDGKTSTVASGFPSTVATIGDLQGVADIAFLDGQLYALIAGGGCSHGNPKAPNGVARVDRATGKWQMIADLSEFAMTHPGKYDNAGDFEPDGVWYNMITVKNELYAIEPNRGVIAAIDKSGHTRELIDISASQGHIVPTSMAERDGELYVGNLLYFPILPQWSRILQISPRGWADHDEVLGVEHPHRHFVSDSKAGFTSVIAEAFGPDGLLYVLEFSDKAGFPAPGNGKVVRIKRSGEIEEVVTGLNVPGGMAWSPDGRLYISDFSAVPAPGFGAGRILRFCVVPGY